MDVSKPYRAISPGVDGDVLVVLAGLRKPRTGSEIARLAGRSQRGVQPVLDRLAEHGLSSQTRAGRAYTYELNRNHLLAPVVIEMAAVREKLFRQLQRAIADWAVQPDHVSLFGSTARKSGDASSDIDLFIVRPQGIDAGHVKWARQIAELSLTVQESTGNHAGISEVSAKELPELLVERPPVIRDLAEHGVDLAGTPFRRLVSAR